MSQIEDIKTLHNQGQFEAAIKGYKKLIDDDPNNDEAHFGMAHASSQINDLEQALKHANEAVKLAPNSDRYQQFKGQMLLANRKIDEALISFKKSLKENPNLFYSYLAVGDIYAIKNESQKAKDNYNFALKVHNDGVPAIIKLSKLLLLEGDYVAAADQLQEAELQHPTEPQLKLQIGIMKLEQNEDGFAELYFKKLLEDEPNNHVAKSYLAISMLNSDIERATELISELLNQKIQIPELMAALGLLYAKNNSHQDAIRYLTPVCQSGLAYPSWLMALAQAYAANLQPNSAMAVLNEILKRGDNPRALMMLGQIHQVNNNHPTAIKTYQRIGKDNPFYHQSLLMQAECQYSAGEFQDTIDKLDPILVQKQDHNTAIKLKLNACSQLGLYDQALALIDSIDSSKQVSEFNHLMHLYAGLLLDAKQDYNRAWEHFKVIEMPPFHEIDLLSAQDEKQVQGFQSIPANSVFRFVFTDPATGHHDFLNWLLQNEVTPLIDRFTTKARGDVFSQQWTVQMLDDLSDAQIHLWRKKYAKQLNQVIQDDTKMIADFIPLTPMNMAVIKRIFPRAHVLILSRNFADLRLHNHVFGNFQVHYSQFTKAANQMIAMNPNTSLIDVDAWHNGDESEIQSIKRIFGANSKPFELAQVTPLDKLMFPYMHWKNYQQQLNK